MRSRGFLFCAPLLPCSGHPAGPIPFSFSSPPPARARSTRRACWDSSRTSGWGSSGCAWLRQTWREAVWRPDLVESASRHASFMRDVPLLSVLEEPPLTHPVPCLLGEGGGMEARDVDESMRRELPFLCGSELTPHSRRHVPVPCRFCSNPGRPVLALCNEWQDQSPWYHVSLDSVLCTAVGCFHRREDWDRESIRGGGGASEFSAYKAWNKQLSGSFELLLPFSHTPHNPPSQRLHY